MIVLDENIPFEERAILKGWRIRFRFIGEEIGYFGLKDANVVQVLHRLKRPTFFTRDEDFFARNLCHASYGLFWLNVRRAETAQTIRRILRHPQFRTAAQRMGLVARAHSEAVHYPKSGSWTP